MLTNKIYNLALSTTHLQLPKAPSLSRTSLNQTNMFNDYRKKWDAHRDLDSSKSYEIVGIKELKAYQERLKKKTRATIRTDTLISDRAISTDTKKTTTQLLSKDQVMQTIPKVHKQTMQSPGFKKRTKRRRESWMTFSTDLEHNIQGNFHESKLQKSHFSPSSVRQRMQEHRNQWKKREFHSGKFPDIYRSIELHRLKLEEREREGMPNEDLVVTRSNLWGQTLRNQKGMRDICSKKDMTRTIHNQDSFSTKGHAKFQSEKLWLQRKDEAGFKFKLYRDGYAEQVKKTVALR